MKKLCLLFIIMALFVSGCSDSKAVTEKTTNPGTDQTVEETQKSGEEEAQAKDGNEEKVDLPKINELSGTIIVSIDNHKRAYPQSGLEKADRVIEILAEGGITRYIAFFNSEKAEKVGPVRSARYYFADIVKPYNAAFAHAGGNSDALDLIPALNIMNLDAIYNAGSAFYRDNSRKKPHNLYTSTDMLVKAAKNKGYDIKPLKKLLVGEVSGGEAAELIDIPYSKKSLTYHVITYNYDDELGKYERYINGKLHETPDNEKILVDNIIVMKVPVKSVVKEEVQSEININSSGRAYFFVDGRAYEGSWKKESSAKDFEFLYNEELMQFKEGKTWIQIVPKTSDVSYSSKEVE